MNAKTPSLPEVHGTIAIPHGAGFWRKMLAFAGPGYLVAVGYMDPGNWATDLAGGALGWVLHRDPDTYRYIPASIRRYPGARGVVKLMEAAGFVKVRHVKVFGGLMAIHFAAKR